MVSKAAALQVRSFGGRTITRGEYRRAVGFLARQTVAAIAAVGAIGIFCIGVTVAAAWLVNGSLSAGTTQKRTMGPGALALAQHDTRLAAADDTSFAAKWASVPGYVRIVVVPDETPKPTSTRIAALAPEPVTLSAPEAPQADAQAKPQPAPQPAPQVAVVAPPPVRPPEPVLSEADRRTALYDIVGKTVYMPNGDKLEAHSGLGDKRDDPRYIKLRMRGPTPPNVYDLTEREALFHGVRAIRLNPVDQGRMHGRDGMLAHSYMLGPNGQSNGCVSFKDYRKFLTAFLNGEVNRLVVVPDLGRTPWRTAVAQHSQIRRYASQGRSGERGGTTW